MNKQDLIDALVENEGLTRKAAGSAIDCVLETIKSGVRAGQKISIVGFGNFSVVTTKPRRVKAPTGDMVNVPSKQKVKFKPSAAFLD